MISTNIDNIGNDQPNAADRMHSVEKERGSTEIIYWTETGSDDVEKTVPHRKVIGTTTTLVIIITVVRLLDRKPANTPSSEYVMHDMAMHKISKNVTCMSLDIRTPIRSRTAPPIMPLRKPMKAFPNITADEDIGHSMVSSNEE